MDRNELADLARRERDSHKSMRLHCCTASGCLATGSAEVKKAMEWAVAERGLNDRVDVVGVGCLGLCGQGPLVGLAPGGVLFEKVSTENAASLVGAAAGETPKASRLDTSQPFFRDQHKVVCET